MADPTDGRAVSGSPGRRQDRCFSRSPAERRSVVSVTDAHEPGGPDGRTADDAPARSAQVGLWRGDEPGVVTFADGTRVRGTGVRHPRGVVADPTRALYLLGRRPAPTAWESAWLRWPDFRLPVDTEAAVEQLWIAFRRRHTERVEIACAGGLGRTGTSLAVMAAWSGTPPQDAVSWVRQHYQPRAVETIWQRRWVRRATEMRTP